MEQDRKEILNKMQSEKMCSLCGDGTGEMCSPADTDTACVCSYQQYLLIRQNTAPIGQMPHVGRGFIDSRASLGL